MPRNRSPSVSSDGSQWNECEYDSEQIFAIIKGHKTFDDLIFDVRLFDSGILTEGCGYNWLKDAWAIISEKRQKAAQVEPKTTEV